MPNKHIRVYELAKELNKTSKEIMAVLAEKNIEVTTHMATLEDNQAELVRGAVGSGQQEAKKEGAAPAKKKKFVVVHNPENSRDKKSPERRPQTQKSAAKPAARPAAARPAAAKPATAPAGATASAGTTAAPAASTAAPKREGAAAPQQDPQDLQLIVLQMVSAEAMATVRRVTVMDRDAETDGIQQRRPSAG